MNLIKRQKNHSFFNFIFFFGSITTIFSFFIIYVTIKNECLVLRNEIHHLSKIHNNDKQRVAIKNGLVNNLKRQDNIEKIAYEKFNLSIPSPESLIVYIGN